MPHNQRDPDQTQQFPPKPAPAFGARFRVVQLLGAGAMGDVYLAEDLKLQRRVAIKCIRAAHRSSAMLLQRIKRECLLHARTGAHPNIVTLYDLIESDEQLLIVMEYVEGEPLDQTLVRLADCGTPMPAERCVAITLECLEALGHTHRYGIIHRDIKPANVMLDRKAPAGPRAKLMDFGIARMEEDDPAVTALTQPGARSPGTPLYMAPEQIDSDTFGPVTPAADLYAMGVMLYHMLAGRPPFNGTMTDIFNGHLNFNPKPFSVPSGDAVDPALWAVIDRAMAKRPLERFASADAFACALKSWLASRTTDAGAVAAPVRIGKTGAWAKVAGAAGLLLLGGLAGWWVFGTGKDGTPPSHPAAPVQQATSIPAPKVLPAIIPPVQKPQNDAAAAEVPDPPDIGPVEVVELTPLYPPRSPMPGEVAVTDLGWSDAGDAAAPPVSAAASPATVTIEAPDAAHAPEPEMGETRTHTVQAGESLQDIAAMHGVSATDLIRWNGLPEPDALAEGQVLYLHEPVEPESAEAEPVVEPEGPAKPSAGQAVKEDFKEVYDKTKRGLRNIGRKVKNIGK